MGIVDKAKNFLSGDKGEEYSDKGLDAAARAADRLSGGTHADKIQSARDSIDSRVGNEGTTGQDGRTGVTGTPGQDRTAAADQDRTATPGQHGTSVVDDATSGSAGTTDPTDRTRG